MRFIHIAILVLSLFFIKSSALTGTVTYGCEGDGVVVNVNSLSTGHLLTSMPSGRTLPLNNTVSSVVSGDDLIIAYENGVFPPISYTLRSYAVNATEVVFAQCDMLLATPMRCLFLLDDSLYAIVWNATTRGSSTGACVYVSCVLRVCVCAMRRVCLSLCVSECVSHCWFLFSNDVRCVISALALVHITYDASTGVCDYTIVKTWLDLIRPGVRMGQCVTFESTSTVVFMSPPSHVRGEESPILTKVNVQTATLTQVTLSVSFDDERAMNNIFSRLWLLDDASQTMVYSSYFEQSRNDSGTFVVNVVSGAIKLLTRDLPSSSISVYLVKESIMINPGECERVWCEGMSV